MIAIQRVISTVRNNIKAENDDYQRIFHGRGHCYPGLEFLTIDYFSSILFIVLYKEVKPAWIQSLVDELIVCCNANRRKSIRSVYVQSRLQTDRPGSGIVNECVYGREESTSQVTENGLRFQVNLMDNQNIGFFPDMAEGRRWLLENARNKHILNLFAYTCTFSVVALASGAHRVVNLDMANNALKTGKINHQLNGINLHQVSFLAHNIFKSWSKLHKLAPFDVVIIDPPSYQPGHFEAGKEYHKVIRRLPRLVSSRGKVMACVNAPHLGVHFLTDLFRQCLPDYSLLYSLKLPSQIPECSNQSGLKIMIYQAPYIYNN